MKIKSYVIKMYTTNLCLLNFGYLRDCYLICNNHIYHTYNFNTDFNLKHNIVNPTITENTNACIKFNENMFQLIRYVLFDYKVPTIVTRHRTSYTIQLCKNSILQSSAPETKTWLNFKPLE